MDEINKTQGFENFEVPDIFFWAFRRMLSCPDFIEEMHLNLVLSISVEKKLMLQLEIPGVLLPIPENVHSCWKLR